MGTQLTQLTKVQRLACIGICGALRTTPTAGMEMILHLLPMKVYIESTAAKSAIRLQNLQKWKEHGHGCILSRYQEITIPEHTDYAATRLDLRTNYAIQIPDRKSWNSNSIIQRNGVPIFTDGSKMENGVGAGVFSKALDLNQSYRLPDGCSVFQAEIFAVKKAAILINDRELPATRVTLYVDSQAAIKALSAATVKSKLVASCRQTLNNVAAHHRVNISWVPGHRGIERNERAYELARCGSNLERELIDQSVGPPIKTIGTLIDGATICAANLTWHAMEGCVISRQLWPALNITRTSALLKLNRTSISTLVGVMTGHCIIGVMATRLGIPANEFCRSCRDEEEQEDVEHLLCHCPALQERRLATLGSRFFEDLGELGRVDPLNILSFIRKSRWFSGPGD